MKFLAAFATVMLLAAAPAVAAPAPKGKPAKAAAPARIVLPRDVRPDRYDIHITPDPGKLTFAGRETIDVTVLKATDRIVLNAADITFGKVSLSGQATAPRVVLDDAQQTAAFVFGKPLAPGRYRLSIEYTGKIFLQASGLFALDYEDKDGKKRALFTQFENSDARRFAPMWDEPGVKSVFGITIDAPKGQMAVSNMPAVSTTDLPDGRQSVRFADSPKMSSYLVFMALGDFERIHRQVGKTDVGVVVRKGDAAKGQFALDAAADLLGFYNDYFDTPYPLPKLDLIAGPGNSQFFSAMENWGAIFYFDYALLIDPKLSTETDRQGVYTTVAHEMAHQWFGDLVTMEWWDQLWLNEGFASWMENKATDHFHPEWNTWLLTQGGQQAAMRQDGRAGTHPIITHIPDVFAAGNAFDIITYQKGQAVIRMLEAYVGETAFRDGVRRYIKAHAYGNTVSDDLWREIDAVSPRKITGMAHDFTLQAGVPLIRAEAAKGGGVQLTQSRFGAEPAQRTPRTWRTPVAVSARGGKSWQGVVAAGAPKTAPLSGPVVVNAGQTGYFRTAYSQALWKQLAPRFATLSAADQLGLLNDSRALGETGFAPMSDFLDLAANTPADADPVVIETLTGQILGLDWLYDGRPGQAAYRAFARSRLSPIAQRLGWDPRPGDTDNTASTRRAVLQALGQMGDPAVVAEARRRFQGWLDNPESLTGANRRTVLNMVAANADEQTWEALHQKAKASRDITDRLRLYRLLGASEDPRLAKKALELALSGEPLPTEVPGVIGGVAARFPDLAYDFALAHRSQIEALLEPASRTSYFTDLAASSRDPAMLDKLTRFSATVPASTRGEIEKSKGAVRYRLDVIAQRMPQMDSWLKARSGS